VSTRRSRAIRWLATLLIRGPEAPFILGDLDDALDRDLSAGASPWRADGRHLTNVLASAGSVWMDRLGVTSLRTVRPAWTDVRLGLRMLIKNPGLTLVAVFALAVGIPVGLAPMHVADAMESHLPEDPDGRIQTLSYWRDDTPTPPTFDEFRLWQTSLTSFDRLAAMRQSTFNVGDAGTPGSAGVTSSMPGVEITASAFDMLGTRPQLGRALTPDDEVPGAAHVAVIGHDLWQSRFAGDTTIVGRMVRIGDVPHQIVGVMPAQFRFPNRNSLWLPLTEQRAVNPRQGAPVSVFGHLADGVTPVQAESELEGSTRAQAIDRPDDYDRLRAAVMPSWQMTFGFPTRGGLRALPEFYFVQAATLLPLVIACVNVGLLIFARTATRASEFAVRTALGASRARILTQAFTEALVLALLATGAGLVLLNWLPARALTTLGVPLPYWIDTGLRASTIVRALVLAIGSAAIAGVIPAMRVTGSAIHQNIQRANARRSGVRFGGMSSALIVLDVAVAVIAVGFATGVGGWLNATRANVAADGIRADQFLSVTLSITDADGPRVAATTQALVDRLRAEPGVSGVAVATTLPRMDHPSRLIEVDPIDAEPQSAPRRARTVEVAPDFFSELSQPILAGRAFDARDLVANSHAVIVNTAFVENRLSGHDAIGRRVRRVAPDGAPLGPWLDIVGVVGHLGVHSIAASLDDGVYSPLVPGTANPVRMAIHVGGDPAAFAARVRTLALDADARAVVVSATPLRNVFEGDWYIGNAIVIGGIILVGVLLSLAASALYAIMSFTVAQRTREIGIRIALGADRLRVVGDVATRALMQIGVGVLLGMPIALIFFHGLGASPDDGGTIFGAALLTFITGTAVMVTIALAACTGPTLRALRISPVDALKGDR
jgi:predicted permease